MIPIQDNVPRRCPPLMTWAIIAVNSIIFFIEIHLPRPVLQKVFYTFGLIPNHYTHGAWLYTLSNGLGFWPFFTCMFLHGGWIHIIGNMWTLWIFGDNVEDEMGHFKFLLFYLLCGIVAGVVEVITLPNSPLPMIGASGAIAGVMGAYYVLFPRARIIILLPIFIFPFFFELPAFFYLAFWFFEQVFTGTLALSAKAFAGIAWWAHIGGFVFGMLTHRLFISQRKPYHHYSDEYRPWGMLSPTDRK